MKAILTSYFKEFVRQPWLPTLLVFLLSATISADEELEPLILTDHALTDDAVDALPVILTDDHENWVIAWQSEINLGGALGSDLDILFTYSGDGGETWSPAFPLHVNAWSDSGSDSFVKLATDSHGNWVAVWQSEDNLGGTAGIDPDIFASYSQDNGVSWSAPRLVNDYGNSDSQTDRLPAIATDRKGTWLIAWETERSLQFGETGDFNIVYSISVDSGATWTPTKNLVEETEIESERDRDVRLFYNNRGIWTAWWSRGRNLLRAESNKPAALWALVYAERRSTPHVDEYDRRPEIASDGTGNFLVLEETGFSIRRFSSDRNMGSFENGARIGDENRAIGGRPPVWMSNRVTPAPFLEKPVSSYGIWPWTTTSVPDTSGYPHGPTGSVLASNGWGDWILFYRYFDHYLTVEYSQNFSRFEEHFEGMVIRGAADRSFDFYGDIDIDANGRWIAVWESSVSRGGILGSDTDILYQRGNFGRSPDGTITLY